MLPMRDVHGDLLLMPGCSGARMNVQELATTECLEVLPCREGEATRIYALTETKESEEEQAGKW